MTDVTAQAPAPTEEQVKAANEAEMAKWEGDYKEEDLAIPYKREEKKDDEAEADKAKGNPDGDPAADKGDGTASARNVEEVQPAKPEPAPVVADPGEYKPADYSFEVTLKDGKTVKVSTAEEAEKLADDPENFETPKQLMDFINKQNKMNRSLDRDFEKWETDKKKFDTQTETDKQQRDTVDGYAKEFTYLIGKKLLPEIPKEYVNADWTNPKVAEQPGVKEQIAILNYMVKENADREKAGVKQLESIVDAYNAWKQDEGTQKAEAERKAQEEANRAAGEARKTAGSRVMGVSASNQQPYVPKGIAVGNPNVLKRGAAVWDD